MPESISEVARLRAQIEQEYAAGMWALSGLASGTARHDFINARLEHMERSHARLSELIGEERATAILCEVFEQPT